MTYFFVSLEQQKIGLTKYKKIKWAQYLTQYAIVAL